MSEHFPQLMELLDEADKLLSHLQLYYPKEVHDAIEYRLNAIYRKIRELENEKE